MNRVRRQFKRQIPSGRDLGAKSKSGASHSKTRAADRLSAYLSHHRTTFVESLLRLLRTPLQSLLTWSVVAIALALPSALYVGLVNVQNLGKGWEGAAKISIFLHQRAKEKAIVTLRERLRSKPEVETVQYIAPAGALEEFQAYSGFGDILKTLDENPLPGVLVVQPAITATPEQLQALSEELQKFRVVNDVSLDMAWVRRLHQLMVLGQRLVTAFAALLAVGILLVIGNTIRLAIESRSDEIVIVKLVGGTNAFVRRPFLYTGWWFGLGGGVLAWALLVIGLSSLSAPVAKLAQLYQSDFRLQGLDWRTTLVLISGSGVLGWLGAWLAVGRHLGSIEPQ